MRLRPGGPGSVRVLCCRHAQGDGPSCGCGRPGIAAEASAICVHVVRRGRVVRRRSASPFPYSRESGAGCLLLGGENTMPRHRHEAGDRLALAGDHVLFAGLALADATGKRLVGLTQTYRLAHRTPVEWVGRSAVSSDGVLQTRGLSRQPRFAAGRPRMARLLHCIGAERSHKVVARTNGRTG